MLSRHETLEKGHGRIERRLLESTSILNGYISNWPLVKQVFRITRQRNSKEEIGYGITSLDAASASASRILEISRSHWAIENSLHYVRDMTFLEDRCRTRCRNKAQLLAAYRNLSITLLHQDGFTCMPEGIEHYADNKHKAIDRIMRQRTE